MNELDKAAYQESRLLDTDAGLFTGGELAEAESLPADMDRLADRAEALNRTLVQRLSKEADVDPAKRRLMEPS